MIEINEKRVQQHLRNFERAMDGYTYTEPLARYLTRFFKENKQMGSSDRRMTSRFCYNYFRLGHSFPLATRLEKLAYSEFLCEVESPIVQLYLPDLLAYSSANLDEKIHILTQRYGLDLDVLFPCADQLSADIDRQAFIKSHFVQPNLFIRVKRGAEKYVKSKLESKGFAYEELQDHTLVLPNGVKLQQIKGLEGKYEVQDLSSQQTINFMEAQDGESWWDTCAASGGKALMFLDKYPRTNLMVSDIRMSILRNLDERFVQAGMPQHYRKKILDLSQDVSTQMDNEQFDGVIVDVPCSGSGTWGRTPEMMQQFTADKLMEFTKLQRSIVRNVIPYLKSGKSLVYMTCSVFAAENELAVTYIQQELGLKLDRMELITGYNQRADTMFAARFIKP